MVASPRESVVLRPHMNERFRKVSHLPRSFRPITRRRPLRCCADAPFGPLGATADTPSASFGLLPNHTSFTIGEPIFQTFQTSPFRIGRLHNQPDSPSAGLLTPSHAAF